MNKNIMLGMLLITSLMCMSIVSAYDAGSPYTVTMKWIVLEDTSFTVTLAGAETTIDFDTNIVNINSKDVEPDSQVAGSSTPIAVIENTGNVNLNFSCNLTATKPSWAVLAMSKTNSVSDAVAVDTTAVVINNSIAPSASQDMYLWTNLTNADSGTTERTFQINSIAE